MKITPTALAVFADVPHREIGVFLPGLRLTLEAGEADDLARKLAAALQRLETRDGAPALQTLAT